MNNFTVIVPVYNKEKYINQIVSVIYAQVKLADEVIFIDDASTDNSLSKLRSMQGYYNFRILENKHNLGVSATRNKGINAASAEYVALLDCDDIWEPCFLKKMSNVLDQEPFHLLGSGYYFKYKNKNTLAKISTKPKEIKVINDYFFSTVTGDLPFTCSSVIINKEAFLSCGGFDESYSMGEDQVLWNSLIINGFKCAILNEALAYYIIDANNSACNDSNKCIVGDFLYRLKIDSLEFSSKYKKKYIKKHLIYVFANAIKSGERQRAVDVTRTSLMTIDLIILFRVILLIPFSFLSKCFDFIYKILDKKRA